jgi:AcrR family transcriptional regulator
MKQPRIDVASIRREQIVEAAIAVIAAQGLQNLSLSEIEKQAGMSRGQLTYYFPAKEDILLAVFDRLLTLTYERIGSPAGRPSMEQAGAWEIIRHLLATVPEQPAASPEFHCLQYTFLSQIGHRADFRERLAQLYEEWRSRMAAGLGQEFAAKPAIRPVAPRALATLVQALLHGLALQHAADPHSFRTEELLHLCVDMLGSYLWGNAAPTNGKNHAPKANKPSRGAAPRRGKKPAEGHRHERAGR